MGFIRLESVEVTGNRVDFLFRSSGLDKYIQPAHKLFFVYNYDLADIPESILAIPFVANLLPLAWLTDSTLELEELDESFYHCLPQLKGAYQEMFPDYKLKGQLRVGRAIPNSYDPEHEAGCLFSGGLDAITTFIRNKDKNPFLITEYGWHGETVAPSEVWEADRANAEEFAQAHGLSNILIESNYGTFLNAANIDYDYHKKLGDSWWHGLHHGPAIISAAIPMAYKLRIKCIFIASSNSPLLKVACASDPTVDNLIKYASGGVFHDGYELSRQDKVRVTVDYYSRSKEPVRIRVCFRQEENCCSCEKCMRTIMGIVAEGKDPRDFGFAIPGDLNRHLRQFLNREVKFFTQTFIDIYWTKIQERMKENRGSLAYPELLEWFPTYDFVSERKKALLKYRVSNFFPIVKRKVSERITRMFAG